MTRARSLSRGVGALVGLGVLIVGVPLGLMLVSRAALGTPNPLHGVRAPWRWSASEIRSTLAHHVSESTLIDVLVRFGVAIVWMCLVVVVATIVAELFSQLRHGVSLPTIRGLGWSQRIAAGIVAGLLAFAPMHHSALPAGGALPLRDARPVATLSVVSHAARSTVADTASATARPVDSEPGWRTHRVKSGESVWDIGTRLGGGDIERTHAVVRQILDANLGRQMSDGSVFHDPGYIESGWLLTVPATGVGSVEHSPATEQVPLPPMHTARVVSMPAEAAAPAHGVDQTAATEHRVVHGDTLWDIIDARYGHVDAEMVWHIAAVNHLENPSAIAIGTVVSLPPLDAATGLPASTPESGDRAATATTAVPAETKPSETMPAQESSSASPTAAQTQTTSIVVHKGDTLSSIAGAQYGDPDAWPTIFQANAGRSFGNRTFDDPNLILPGWTLSVPDDATVPSSPAPPPRATPPDATTAGATTPGTSGTASPPTGPSVDTPSGAAPSSDASATLPPDPGSTISLSTVTSPTPARQLPATPATATGEPPAASATPTFPPPRPGERPATDASAAQPADTASATADNRTSTAPTSVPHAGPVEIRTDVGVSPADNADEPAPEPIPVIAPRTPAVPAATLPVSLNAQGQRRIPLGPASALVLASGVIGLVEARRRRRLRSAGYAQVASPAPDTAQFEASLRQRSDTERLTRLDLAVRCAAPHLATHAMTLLGASVTPTGEIDLVVGAARDEHGSTARRPLHDPPAPFVDVPARGADTSASLVDATAACAEAPFGPTLGVRSWRLPASVATEDIPIRHRFGAFPAPLLTHVGASGGDDVFVDLEAFGSLAVVGDADRAATVVHGLIGSLSLSPFAETVSMSCVGLSVHAGPLPRLSHVDDLAGAVAEANDFAASSDGADRSTSMFDLRTTSSGETWEPAVVAVCGAMIEDAELSACIGSAAIGHGVVAIVDRDIAGAGVRLTEVADGWLLSPLGIVVKPVGLTEDDLIELDELIAVADVQPTPIPLVSIADEEAAFQEMPWTLMVRLLGPVDVVDISGSAATVSKSKAVELVAWLAEHRSTATRTGARSAMWEADVRDATFANVVSEARRSLARLAGPPEGMEWIARTQTEQLPLHPLVVSDAAVLRQRLDFARACADAEEAAYVLHPGVQLVRDIPFSGVNYTWADSEGSLSNLTLLITAAATELATRYLLLQNLEGVFWASGRGLAVLPGHEDLIGLRMRARHDAGDHAGLRAEWDAYERVMNADTWSDGEPSERMEALRRELMRPSLSRRP